METNNIYQQMMNGLLTKWDAEICLLDTKAENAATDTKLRYVSELDVLHAKKREATKTLKELETASGEAR